MLKFNEYYNTILDYLRDGNEKRNSDIIKHCAEVHHVSDEEMAKTYNISSNVSIFKDRVNWAITYLRKANLISKVSHGVNRITQLGMNVKEIDKNDKFLKKYINVDGGINIDDSTNIEDDVDMTPDEMLDKSIRELKEDCKHKILEKISVLSWQRFEDLVCDLISEMYNGEPIYNKKKLADGGMDGYIKLDKLGFDNIYVQAKKWKDDSKIGSPEIDKFSGSLNKFINSNGKGVFITTGKFSDAAKDAVEKNKNHIILIDGEKLVEYMIQYNIGVEKKSFDIPSVDNDYFDIVS